MRTVTVAGLLAAILLLGGCARGGGSGEGTTSLSAAADRVDRQVRSSSSYAGVEVDDRNDRLVVYRKPDPALDARVRAAAGDVEVEFHDAPYARQELQPVADRVDADRYHWSQRKVTVRVVQPRADGTGVSVLVHADDLATARARFAERYGDQVIVSVPAAGAVQPA